MEFQKYFEEFLREHFVSEVCSATTTELEQILTSTGMSETEAAKKAEPLYSSMIDSEHAAYSQGIKDGARLLLHLLDMAPENKKEVSQ
ncbi:MAG: hypothetical protein ABSC17_06010 [Thermacetogeniaceae bacterium]